MVPKVFEFRDKKDKEKVYKGNKPTLFLLQKDWRNEKFIQPFLEAAEASTANVQFATTKTTKNIKDLFQVSKTDAPMLLVFDPSSPLKKYKLKIGEDFTAEPVKKFLDDFLSG